jgi:hypothetical protein
LFFHPAVWFLSRRLSAEREYCCDDVALSRGLGSIRYAELLVRLAEVRCRVPLTVEQQVALAAVGDRPSQLRRRVARLFGLEEELTMTLSRRGAVTLTAMFLIVAAVYCLLAPAESPADTDRNTAKQNAAHEHATKLKAAAELEARLTASRFTPTELLLLGTWEHQRSNGDRTQLTLGPDRTYRYEYTYDYRVAGQNPKTGEWKVEGDNPQLVYQQRNQGGVLNDTFFWIPCLRTGTR